MNPACGTAKFTTQAVNEEIMNAKPVYEGIFGQLQFDPDHADLASTQALVSKGGHKFLRQHFKPGDLIETANGVQMLDKNYNVMKAGFHNQNPEKAKKLAGLA
jgi:hypothetical protein